MDKRPYSSMYRSYNEELRDYKKNINGHLPALWYNKTVSENCPVSSLTYNMTEINKLLIIL